MNKFIGDIKHYINDRCLLNDNDKVIVAFSGGADSTALLTTLHSLGYKVIAAHCNFHLRGEESDRDMEFAISLTERYNIPLKLIHFDVDAYKKAHGVSTEMACRDLRYNWFKELSEEFDCKVATAHHRDDNIETLFLNLLRGTGIKGAHGMSPISGYVIRPFLETSRKDIEKYLQEISTDYVNDSTNAVNDVKRNKLRNIVLPTLEKEFPETAAGLSTSIHNLERNAHLYEELIARAKTKYVTGDTINICKIRSEIANAATFLYEIIAPYDFSFIQASNILETVEASTASGQSFFSPTHEGVVNRGLFTVRPIQKKEDSISEIELRECEILQPVHLKIEYINPEEVIFSRKNDVLYLDSGILSDTDRLTLRHWKEGDRFFPFGMSGSRLVSDIFSDAKLSLFEKKDKFLLCAGDKILWIPGLKASRFYPVTGSSIKIVKISLL